MSTQEKRYPERAAPQLPSGAQDILLHDAQIKSEVLEHLRSVFRSWGYIEAVTPTFERYQTLLDGGLDPASMLTFSDCDGDLLALRPDLTAPIARVVATRLRDLPRPMRLYYQGHIFRRPGDDRRQSVESAQAGIELIGAEQAAADAEIAAIAVESLARLGLKDFQLNLGHIGVFQGILAEANLPGSAVSEIKQWIDRKDRNGLTRCLRDLSLTPGVRKQLFGLLKLSGRREVLDQARRLMMSKISLAALDNLESIYEILSDYQLTDRIILDLAEVRGLGYYTGLMFEGFSRSAPVRILSGGRYDTLIGRFGLDCPAVGCAFDIGQIRSVIQTNRLMVPQQIDVLVRCPATHRSEALSTATELRQQGLRAELAVTPRTMEETLAYATSRGIQAILDITADGDRMISVARGAPAPEPIRDIHKGETR